MQVAYRLEFLGQRRHDQHRVAGGGVQEGQAAEIERCEAGGDAKEMGR